VKMRSRSGHTCLADMYTPWSRFRPCIVIYHQVYGCMVKKNVT